MQNNEQSVKEVQDTMAKWAKALESKDLVAMHQDHATEYRLFDVGTTANGVEETKILWEKCFPFFDRPKIEYQNMVIHASNDMAVAHFNAQIKGLNIQIPEEMANSWLRGTVCFRKSDGIWKCVHEHISFPVNCETNQIDFQSV